jgi:hypothetical protein
MGPTPRLVFISHSSRDTGIVRQLARRIEDQGAQPFLDEADVKAGDDFEEAILTFLERADELVVLWTPWALDRPFVWTEIGAAWVRPIPIVQVLHGVTASELQSRAGFPTPLKRRDMIDLNDVDAYFEQLRERVVAGGAP